MTFSTHHLEIYVRSNNINVLLAYPSHLSKVYSNKVVVHFLFRLLEKKRATSITYLMEIKQKIVPQKGRIYSLKRE